MLDLSNRLLALAIVVFVFSGLGNQVSALTCRDGIENSVGYVYWSQKCSAGETACFQSVKCTKIGDTPYTDYQWNCIDGKLCANSTGKSVATYKGVKGKCCFTNNCNAYKGACTDSGTNLIGSWMPLAFAVVLAYFFI